MHAGGGGAGRRTGNSSTPPPTSLSSQFLWTPSKAARGSPIPISHGQGWQGAGMEGRFSSPSSGEREVGGPTAPTRRVALCPRPPLSIGEEARGSVKILAKVTAGRALMSAPGVSPSPSRSLMGWLSGP